MHKAGKTLKNWEYDETCGECGESFRIDVDYSCPHLEAVCPGCGGKLMLCGICKMLDGGSCDWHDGGCSMDRYHRVLNGQLYW